MNETGIIKASPVKEISEATVGMVHVQNNYDLHGDNNGRIIIIMNTSLEAIV